jgi:hypothetical protein
MFKKWDIDETEDGIQTKLKDPPVDTNKINWDAAVDTVNGHLVIRIVVQNYERHVIAVKSLRE